MGGQRQSHTLSSPRSQGAFVSFSRLADDLNPPHIISVMAPWKKYLIGEWNWKRPIKSFAFIYGALLIVALCFADRMIYHPPLAGYTDQTAHIQVVRDHAGQKTGLFYLPAAQHMPTLLWSHGNAEDIGLLKDRFQCFHARGYGILAYDYPGYGISSGSPDEKGCFAAGEIAWEHLTGKLNIKPEEIILYGQSVGSGPACWLAAQHPHAGLILVSPLTSAFRSVTRIPIFPGDQHQNIHLIEKIDTPLLVIHGDQDRVIAPWNGKKLYELHSGHKKFVTIKGAGHNDLFILAENEILDAIDAFKSAISNL